MSRQILDTRRPYLVIPKLVEQPTWGGAYIAGVKKWESQEALAGKRLGQSYELFSGSNLSLATSSLDTAYRGELTDRDAVENPTSPLGSISLAKLIETSPAAVLGSEIAARTGGVMNVLIKLTQAMGNSFQIHLKDGATHPFWKPKPESWYYLEPGLITLGVKPDTDWQAYQDALTAVNDRVGQLQDRVHSNAMTYDVAQAEISELLEQYNPWAFVNMVQTKKDQLVDLSGGGLHHSWEEDAKNYPLGNVLYEVQVEAMDHNSTMRGFDKGNMSKDGLVRTLNIEDYFELIDRAPGTNDPASHMRSPEPVAKTEAYLLEKLLTTKYYSLSKLMLHSTQAKYSENIAAYRHIFVQEGTLEVSTSTGAIEITQGHSCFVPASATEYSIKSMSSRAEVLITT